MAKHTPGPWEWSPHYRTEDGRETWTLLGANGYGILACDGEGNSPQGIGDESNADLIAAAPDLLEALENMMPEFESRMHDSENVEWHECWNSALAAIAKAKATGAAQ